MISHYQESIVFGPQNTGGQNGESMTFSSFIFIFRQLLMLFGKSGFENLKLLQFVGLFV